MLNTSETAPVERRPVPAAEATASSHAAEEKMKIEASPIEPASGKRVDTMSRAELMEVSQHIIVDGSNLRHIYETHLIGEHGLRRLVAEHLRGGNLPKALRREVMQHEMDFERDPVMRNLAPPAATALESGHNASLEKLLEKANVSMPDSDEENAFIKARHRHETAGRQRQHHQLHLLDIGLAAFISVLVLLVIFIYVSRG